MRPALLGELADATGYVGALDRAAEVLDSAFKWIERSDDRWAEPELHRVRAVLALRRGDVVAAREAIDAGLTCARSMGADGLAARLNDTLATIPGMTV